MKKKKKTPTLIGLVAGLMVGFSTAQIPSVQSLVKPMLAPPYLPFSNPFIQREAYALAYDGRIKSASWVYEKLTASFLKGKATRASYDFMEDPLIPKMIGATKADYKGSGFDRGHLCPAADARATDQSMKETFYFSNISPQNPQLNRQYWVKLEKHVRDLTQSYDQVYAITGPLFLAKTDKNGKRYVHYEVIGASEVAVPTHYFKVVRAVKGDAVDTKAYIIPNEEIPQDPPLDNFAVSIEKIEKAAGFILDSKEI